MQKKYHIMRYFLPPIIVIGGFFAVNFYSKTFVKDVDEFGGTSAKTNDVVLRSFYDNATLYTSECQSDLVQRSHIIAGVTSHHFLAQDLIVNFFCGIADKPQHVIIISPDHFQQFHDQGVIAYVTQLSWDTPFGAIANDDDISTQFDAISGVEKNDRPFFREHGIYTLVPFIAKYFSDARITSVIVNTKADQQMISALGQEIRKIAGDDTLLIVSSDFSHHGDVSTTAMRDKKSIEALTHFSSAMVENIACDCMSCMTLLEGYLRNDRSFVLQDHKNSMEYSGIDHDITSYVSGYFIVEKSD